MTAVELVIYSVDTSDLYIVRVVRLEELGC